MFADDTKIWTKIDKMEVKESLKLDLDNLVEWSKNWLLVFYTEKRKMMHIGHKFLTKHSMADGHKVTQLEATVIERDLGIWITDDLKSTEQCVQGAKKAQALLEIVNYFSQRH